MNTTKGESKKHKKSATTIVIVSKTGTLSETVVEPENETTLEELTILLSKKCGYRNHDGFSCYHTYKYKNKKKFTFNMDNEDVIPQYIYVDVWAKTDGRAGNENKYEIYLMLNYLKNNAFNELKKVCPYLTSKDRPSSLYLKIK